MPPATSTMPQKLPLLPLKRIERSTAGARVTFSGKTKRPGDHPCLECAASFTKACDVERHKKSRHTKGPIWECNICPVWYVEAHRTDIINRHRQQTHPGVGVEGRLYDKDVVIPSQSTSSAPIAPDGRPTRRRKRSPLRTNNS